MSFTSDETHKLVETEDVTSMPKTEVQMDKIDNQKTERNLELSFEDTQELSMQIDQPEASLPADADADAYVGQGNTRAPRKDATMTGMSGSEADEQLSSTMELVVLEQQQQQQVIVEHTTGATTPMSNAQVLTPPPPSPTEPKVGGQVKHRVELRWERREGTMFYREELGSATPHTRNDREKEAQEGDGRAILHDGKAIDFCSSLNQHPVSHDLTSDRRHYPHKLQSLPDPYEAALPAVREKYKQPADSREKKGLDHSEVSQAELSSEKDPCADVSPAVALPLVVTSPVAISPNTPETTLSTKEDNDIAVIGFKRPAPETLESTRPSKRARKASLPPPRHEVRPPPPSRPALLLPPAAAASDVFTEQATIQQRAFVEELRAIKQDGLICGQQAGLVEKVLFDKSRGCITPELLKRQSSSIISVTATGTMTGRAQVSLTAPNNGTNGSQDNPISLEDGGVTDLTDQIPRTGTANNPISIGVGFPETKGSLVISPASIVSSSVPVSVSSSVRSSGPSPEPLSARVTRSAKKKAAATPDAQPSACDGIQFYKTNNPTLLRYQDVETDQGVIPGTLLTKDRKPHRLLIDKFRADKIRADSPKKKVGALSDAATKGLASVNPSKLKIDPQRTALHSSTFWGDWFGGKETQTQSTTVDPFAAAAMKRWVDDASKTRNNQPTLLRGFPMVEGVTFLRADNRNDEGNCYWNALALHMYGRLDFGPRVKLEHLRFVEAVLGSPEHPRHETYTKVNGRFFETNAEGLQGGPFVANMWQILHLPGSWTPSWMTQITADLYGIFIVLYTLETESVPAASLLVTETTTRGAYNSRHIFLLFVDGNHYQPMIPNEYDPSEFRCPRPAKAFTRGYIFGDSKRWGDGVFHGWRRDVTFGNRVPMSLPVDHNMGANNVEINKLIKAMMGGGTGNRKLER